MKRFKWMFVLLLAAGCAAGEYKFKIVSELKQHREFAKIDLSNYKPVEVNLSELMEKIEYVRLETNSDCLIGGVDKLMIRNDRIYILDREKAASLFVFDKNGKFLFKLRKGIGGPGEFIDLSDFSISEPDSTIYVLSSKQQLLYAYDLAGKFKRTIHMPPYIDCAESIGDGSFLLYREGASFGDRLSEARVMVLTRNGNIASGWFTNALNKYVSPEVPNPIGPSQDNDHLVLMRPYENIIYSFDRRGNDMRIKYQIDFGKDDLQEYGNVQNYDQLEAFSSKSSYHIGGTLDRQRYLYFLFYDQKTVRFYFRSRANKREYVISRFVNDIDYILPYPFQYGDEHCLVSVLPSGTLKELHDAAVTSETESHDPKLKNLLEYTRNIDEMDNPVIAKYFLKETL